jgi:phage regulator Rha-like protein
MKIRSGIIYTAQQRVFTWESYQKGSSLNNIARLFEWQHSSVSRLISEHAGIRSNEKKGQKII